MPNDVETALYYAARLLSSWEQAKGLVGQFNSHRQALDRCAVKAGYDDLNHLHDSIDAYWRDQDETWQGVY